MEGYKVNKDHSILETYFLHSKTYELFKELRFNKYIEKFNLANSETVEEKDPTNLFEYEELLDAEKIKEVLKELNSREEVSYFFELKDKQSQDLIIKSSIEYVALYDKKDNKVYSFKFDKELIKELFENENSEKVQNHAFLDVYIYS
jgi:hypothetical protein